MTLIIKEGTAIRNLLKELDIEQGVVTLYEDNQPSIDLLKRSTADGLTKHIDVRYYYIREQVDQGLIKVVKIHTDQQAANGLIKQLNRIKHEKFGRMIGMFNCSQLINQLVSSSPKD
jgi:hypothetical protein